MNASDDQCCPAYPNCHEPVPGPLVAAQEAAPTIEFSYADRFALSMLGTRKVLCESYGLMKEAREVEEQIRAIREWQILHLGALLPTPGVVPVHMHGGS